MTKVVMGSKLNSTFYTFYVDICGIVSFRMRQQRHSPKSSVILLFPDWLDFNNRVRQDSGCTQSTSMFCCSLDLGAIKTSTDKLTTAPFHKHCNTHLENTFREFFFVNFRAMFTKITKGRMPIFEINESF